jgi:hypothetical protein
VRRVSSFVEFDIEISKQEIAAIRRILSGNKVKFDIEKKARLQVTVTVEVKEEPKERQ